MKNGTILLASILLITFLTGCSKAPTYSPPSQSADPHPVTTGNGFSIHLLAGKIPPSQMEPNKPIELDVEPLLSMDDIAAYSKTTHEIQLNEQGYEKIHALKVPTNGLAFAVCVDDKPIYTGAFWVLYSSLSYDGIVIDPLQATEENPILQIKLGYPVSTAFEGEDLRSDPAIIDTLEKVGKLR